MTEIAGVRDKGEIPGLRQLDRCHADDVQVAVALEAAL